MAQFLIMILAASVLFSTLLHCVFSTSTTLMLERISSASVAELTARDHERHSRILLQSSSPHGVAVFPVQGSADPYASGLYFTKVKLGNPAKEFHVAIDTGSDITWVNCNPCNGCPRTSRLIQLSFFDPRSSSSAAHVFCSDRLCKSVAHADHCPSDSFCEYSMLYGDGSSASGVYMSDMLHLDTILGNSLTASFSPDIIFGCSNIERGLITQHQTTLDGILGLGHHSISIISQLASRGVIPNVFSHCLKGDKSGGGILVLGEIIEPGMIYSPLVPSQSHYNLNLLSISINGQTLPIDPKVFSTSRHRQGTIVDSGTTFAYLTEEAYDPFITTLSAAVPPSMSSYSFGGSQCFLVSNSHIDGFPLVSLNFAGGASMVLKPEEYLLQRIEAGPNVWCIGIQKSPFPKRQGLTILGDLVLKNKIIVYDLARQRLGWAAYDCSSSINVSLAPPSKPVSSSSRDGLLYPLIPIATAGFLFL